MKASFVTMIMTYLLSTGLFAHGMNKPGPHNGYVRMPGSYHVELVPESAGYRVYFLDMQFKDISIKDATATMVIKSDQAGTLNCKKEAEYFLCPVEKKILKNAKEIVLETSINGKTKSGSRYSLPLSFM